MVSITSPLSATTARGNDALTSLRVFQKGQNVEHLPVLCNSSFNLWSFPIRCWKLAYFFVFLLPCLSPPFFLCLVQHLTPDADGSHAQIPVELLDGIKKGLIVRRKQDMRSVLGVEGKPIRYRHRTWRRVSHSAPLA